MSSEKRCYFFSPEQSDADQSYRNLLGGKGANLAEMCGHLPHSPLTGLHARTRTAQAFPAYTYAPASSLPPLLSLPPPLPLPLSLSFDATRSVHDRPGGVARCA